MEHSRYEQIYNSLNPLPHQTPRVFEVVVNEAEKMQPKVILEVGQANCGSLRFWEELLLNNGFYDGLIISVDWMEGQKKSWDWEHSAIKIKSIYGDSTSIETAKRVKNALEGRPVDYLFIDGGHRDEVPEHDYNNYAPMVRMGGLICVADIGEACASNTFLQLPNERYVDPDVGMGFWKKDRELTVKTCNELGYSIDDKTGMHMRVLKMYHPSYMNRNEARINNWLR